MPTVFKYKALTSEGDYKIGQMTVEQKSQVTDFLKDNELIPIEINPVKPKLKLSNLGFFKKIDYEALIIFTNNLATTYRAGIPLLRALSMISTSSKNEGFNEAVEKIKVGVQSGKSLSMAMAEHTDYFTPVYVNSIAAGEESGKLEEILEELSHVLENEMEISRQVKSGLRYPTIVIITIMAAFTVLMVFVMPKFISFYGSFNAELPLPTRIMIGLSNIFTNYWPMILVGLGGAIFGFKYFISTESGRQKYDRFILKLPVLGGLVIKGNVARFAYLFKILFKSGLPIIKSLNILAESIKNSAIQNEIRVLEELFQRGSESEITAHQFDYFPDLAKQMIAIGLETGSLENMLEEIGGHYSKEVNYTSRHLTAILEPILTFVVAGFVLVMALAIFLPMWNLIKVFNG